MAVAILLAVFVNSLLLLPAIFMFWIWDQETPTPKREKKE
jgi:hypothetical protein